MAICAYLGEEGGGPIRNEKTRFSAAMVGRCHEID